MVKAELSVLTVTKETLVTRKAYNAEDAEKKREKKKDGERRRRKILASRSQNLCDLCAKVFS